MNIRSFLGLVEIRTKFASMIPFFTGSIYVLYRFEKFYVVNFLILMMSVLAFDMVTTALNNYFDFKRAIKKQGYNFEEHNKIVKDKLGEVQVLLVIFGLLLAAIISGLFSFFRTDIVVLLLGMVSFGIGISYSFGPIPISRTPLGELFSGFFMGFIITFLSAYVHIYDQNIIVIEYSGKILQAGINVEELARIFFVSVPAILSIANIMLANNICDIEDDIENRRFTLPVFVGRKNALRLFKISYYIAYIDIAVLTLIGAIPAISLLVLLTFIMVARNIKVFYSKQTKKETFSLSVMNFLYICLSQLIAFTATVLFDFLFA